MKYKFQWMLSREFPFYRNATTVKHYHISTLSYYHIILHCFLVYFTRKMKLNIWVVGAFGVQEPLALGQVNQVAVFIGSNVVRFKAGKLIQLFGVGTGYPAGFVIRHCPEFARSAILLQQAVLNYLKLQVAHATNDLFITTKLGEQLGHPFV